MSAHSGEISEPDIDEILVMEPKCKKQRKAKEPREREAKRYCLTCNNYTSEDIPQPHPWVAYCCYAFEKGSEQETPHIQGYFETNTRCTLKRFIKEVPWLKRYHIEERYKKATLLDQQLYCQKLRCRDIAAGTTPSEGYTEFGTPIPTQGARVDLDQLAKKIRTGETTYDQVLNENPMAIHQFGRTLQQVEDSALTKRRRDHMTQGIWLYGKTGVGKSHTLRRLAEIFGEAYDFPKDKGWHDLYRGQDIIACDDFSWLY